MATFVAPPTPYSVPRLLRRYERAAQRYGPDERAQAQRQRAERAADGKWRIEESGLRFQVTNLDNGHTYHVLYLPDAPAFACWLCDCPDFAGSAAAYGVLCKHIQAVHQSGHVVAMDERTPVGSEAPTRVVPGSLIGVQADEQVATPQTHQQKEIAMDQTLTLQEVMAAFRSRPFSVGDIQWKPQATNKSKDNPKAMGVPYADPRAYEDVLNEVVPADWSSQTMFLVAGTKLICTVHLTICGVTRSGDGDALLGEDNTATSAYAQAFKRACSRFGLGRYLYDIPKLWVAYDNDKKRITEEGEQKLVAAYQRTVAQLGQKQSRHPAGGKKAVATPTTPATSASGGEGKAEALAGENGAGQASVEERARVGQLLQQVGFSSEAAQRKALQDRKYDPDHLTSADVARIVTTLTAHLTAVAAAPAA